MTFDGFISYSHAADGRLAPAVQRGLHRLAKPWHRRRALWIFRDQTGLSVTPGLWSSIQTAMDGSEYFVLLASPEAAQSPWVNREIEHWIGTKAADRILPVVTDGEWAWDEEIGDFTEGSTAVPMALRGVFAEEPFFLDLRWARGSEHLSLQHTRFRDAIAQLAAPMHGMSKDDLEGEDVRQHRRARRLRSAAVATLVVLSVLASVAGLSAVRNGERAKAAAAEAMRQQQVASEQRGNAERSAAEARRQQELADQQQTRAAQARAAADEAERQAEQQQKLADEAAAEARRQRALADAATSRKQEQERLAKAAADRAEAAQQEADRLAAIAAEKQRLADEAAAEAEKQQRVAISRRLLNQATATSANDQKTALMLGVAAQSLTSDATTRAQLAGAVTESNYAGAVAGDVTGATYAPDGVLATISSDGRVSLWNVKDPLRPSRIATVTDQAAGSNLAFSPDGRTLAFLNTQKRAVLWDVADRSRPALLSTITTRGSVNSFAFGANPYGTIFVAGDGFGLTTIWDASDPARPALLSSVGPISNFPVVRLSLSPTGRFLVIDVYKFTLYYDLSDPFDPFETVSFAGLVFGSRMAFSPDGTLFATGNSDSTVSLYDLRGNGIDDEVSPPLVQSLVQARPQVHAQPQAQVQPQAQPQAQVQAEVQAETSATLQTPPATMPTLDPDYGIGTLKGATGAITSLAFSADGKSLIAGDVYGMATIWELRTKAVVGSVRLNGLVSTVAADPKTGRVVTADGSTAAMWRIADPNAPAQVAGFALPDASTARATVFTADGRSLITATSSGTASTWNVAVPARPVRGADLTLRGSAVRSVVFSPDRRTVATVDAGAGTLTVAPVAQPSRTTTLATLTSPGLSASAMVFSPDGRTLAVADSATKVKVWDVADLAHPVLLTTVTGAFGTAMALGAGGKTLATSADYTVTLWDLADLAAPAKLAILAGHSGTVNSIAFTPDGHTLATGSADNTAVLWDVTDRAQPIRLATLNGHSESVGKVAFSADGRTLAVPSKDETVILWDTAVPSEPIRLARLWSIDSYLPASAATFSGDGRTMAVTSEVSGYRPVVSLWDYRKLNSLRANPAKYACAITGRGLTAAEWARYVPELKYRKTC